LLQLLNGFFFDARFAFDQHATIDFGQKHVFVLGCQLLRLGDSFFIASCFNLSGRMPLDVLSIHLLVFVIVGSGENETRF
jgi:hypothetical protein